MAASALLRIRPKIEVTKLLHFYAILTMLHWSCGHFGGLCLQPKISDKITSRMEEAKILDKSVGWYNDLIKGYIGMDLVGVQCRWKMK